MKNRHHLTEAVLRALASDQAAYTFIYLFDNDSRPPVLRTRLPALAPRTTVHERPGLGILTEIWNQASEMAARHAAGRSHNVIFLNNDIIITCGLVRALVGSLRSAKDIAIVYPNYDGRPATTTRLQETHGIAPDGGMCGFAFALRGELAIRVDAQFRWWCGDADIELQARRLNMKVCCDTKVPVRHLEPYKSTAASARLTAIAAEDRRRFAEKYGFPDVGRDK